jgi:hypothetical protein
VHSGLTIKATDKLRPAMPAATNRKYSRHLEPFFFRCEGRCLSVILNAQSALMHVQLLALFYCLHN